MNVAFSEYSRGLETLAIEVLKVSEFNPQDDAITSALNGGPRLALTRTISIQDRRKGGVFFTGSDLARQTLRELTKEISEAKFILDPACGAGDLLLRCAQLLSTQKSIEGTLCDWGNRLAGFDIYSEFVRVTRARLVLAARIRDQASQYHLGKSLDDFFPNIKTGDCFQHPDIFQKASLIVLNPPFQYTTAPIDCEWASGKISNAALFLERCVSNALPDAQVVAILPDVLRSGNRYSKWRKLIESKATIESVDSFGQFDQWTDIDVFILRLRIGKPVSTFCHKWQSVLTEKLTRKVGDLFEIHVGTVVPYRNEEEGKSYPYLTPKNLPAWKTVVKINTERKFSGKTFRPPFVVVRRTSRPGDKNRAIGTIISGKESIAIENHLLVLLPKDGSLGSCHKLLRNLRMGKSNDWLDRRIRCRHLTVSSIAELPWWDSE